jgi:hypothetical protein
MLVVDLPFDELPEADYVLGVVLRNWLGIPFVTRRGTGTSIVLTHADARLEIECPLLLEISERGPAWVSAPSAPLAMMDSTALGVPVRLTSPFVPVLFGGTAITTGEGRLHIAADLFGGIFFMLSRIEELHAAQVDEFGRFDGHASTAYRCGFHTRPIADEYTEILWSAMQRLWPAMERRVRAFSIDVSCDVDHPYSVARTNPMLMARHAVRDVLHHSNPALAAIEVLNYASHIIGSTSYRFDHCHAGVDFLLDQADRAGHGAITFFFKAGSSHEIHDFNDYGLDEPVVKSMLQTVAVRGHDIGIHPSFETYRDPDLLRTEADRLRRALRDYGIGQTALGGRQHFLRWHAPDTARAYESAGLDFDATLGFAELAGFRCGTCHAFQMFDVALRRPLSILQRPLIVMEDAVLRRMALGASGAALDHMTAAKDSCRLFDGQFTLLWHNSNFLYRQSKDIYRALIA